MTTLTSPSSSNLRFENGARRAWPWEALKFSEHMEGDIILSLIIHWRCCCLSICMRLLNLSGLLSASINNYYLVLQEKPSKTKSIENESPKSNGLELQTTTKSNGPQLQATTKFNLICLDLLAIITNCQTARNSKPHEIQCSWNSKPLQIKFNNAWGGKRPVKRSVLIRIDRSGMHENLLQQKVPL